MVEGEGRPIKSPDSRAPSDDPTPSGTNPDQPATRRQRVCNLGSHSIGRLDELHQRPRRAMQKTLK